jgi:ferrochelatase
LPQRLIERGDPYQWQVEQTVAAVVKLLPAEWETGICYQSRVGPLQWLGPATPDAISAAARDKVGVIVSPIAFVSDHVETLVELDIEYAHLAKSLELPFYLRAPALGAAPRFIDALADLAELAMTHPGALQSESGGRLCPAQFGMCAQQGR